MPKRGYSASEMEVTMGLSPPKMMRKGGVITSENDAINVF